MPLIQAKCTNCGANLEVDNSKDAAICPYCNSAYIVEKAIQNFNTYIKADTITIEGQDSAKELAYSAMKFISVRDYDNAMRFASKLANTYISDYRGYYILLISETHSFDADYCCNNHMLLNNLEQLYKKAIVLVTDPAEKTRIQSEWERFSDNFKIKLEEKEVALKQSMNMQEVLFKRQAEEADKKREKDCLTTFVVMLGILLLIIIWIASIFS